MWEFIEFSVFFFSVSDVVKLVFDCYIAPCSLLLFIHYLVSLLRISLRKKKIQQYNYTFLYFFSKNHWNCFLSNLLISISFTPMGHQWPLVEKRASNCMVSVFNFYFLSLYAFSILTDICFYYIYLLFYLLAIGFWKYLTAFPNCCSWRRLKTTENLLECLFSTCP